MPTGAESYWTQPNSTESSPEHVGPSLSDCEWPGLLMHSNPHYTHTPSSGALPRAWTIWVWQDSYTVWMCQTADAVHWLHPPPGMYITPTVQLYVCGCGVISGGGGGEDCVQQYSIHRLMHRPHWNTCWHEPQRTDTVTGLAVGQWVREWSTILSSDWPRLHSNVTHA